MEFSQAGGRSSILHQQDIDFYEGLIQDQLNDLYEEREKIRHSMDEILKLKIPDRFEEELTSEEQRLIRSRRYLSGQDAIRADQLIGEMNRLRTGCFNMDADEEREIRNSGSLFIIQIPGVDVSFCVDVASFIYNDEALVNTEFGIVDDYLNLRTGERYKYPLDHEQSMLFIQQADKLNLLQEGAYEEMKFENIEETSFKLGSLIDKIKYGRSDLT